jgi:hypothetical protein
MLVRNACLDFFLDIFSWPQGRDAQPLGKKACHVLLRRKSAFSGDVADSCVRFAQHRCGLVDPFLEDKTIERITRPRFDTVYYDANRKGQLCGNIAARQVERYVCRNEFFKSRELGI